MTFSELEEQRLLYPEIDYLINDEDTKNYIASDMDQYMDIENRTCNFDSEDFIFLLEFLKNNVWNSQSSEEEQNLSDPNLVLNKRLLLYGCDMYSPGIHQMLEEFYEGETETFEFPGLERGHSLFVADQETLAIPVTSAKKGWSVVIHQVLSFYLCSRN